MIILSQCRRQFYFKMIRCLSYRKLIQDTYFVCRRFLCTPVTTTSSSDTPVAPVSALSDDDQIQNSFNKTVEKIQAEHGSKYNFSLDNLHVIMNYLILTHEIQVNDIVKMFCKHPRLCEVSKSKWIQTMETLRGHDILATNIIHMVAKCPQIVQTNTKQLDSSLQVFQYHDLTSSILNRLLVSAPMLLITNKDYITDRINNLKSVVTKKDLYELIPNCPNVLVDDWEVTEEKIQYVLFMIGMDQRQIVKSCVLRHSLEQIQVRHQIMIRTGHFKKPKPKQQKINTTLSTMVDTPLHDFLKLVEITQEDYEVFEKLYEKEDKPFDNDQSTVSDSEDETDE